jgi:hypothetical protein
MARMPKVRTLELFAEDTPVAVVSFTFTFSNTGNYTAWQVLSNGKERSRNEKSGSFSGTIMPGKILRVTFKVWDGSYSISYECKSGSVKKSDPNQPSPMAGTAIGEDPKTYIVDIQF